MKNRDDSSYFHLAAATDEQAVKTLRARDFFKHYTEKTRQVAGGEVIRDAVELIDAGVIGDLAGGSISSNRRPSVRA